MNKFKKDHKLNCVETSRLFQNFGTGNWIYY
jgi:hypothetical protein